MKNVYINSVGSISAQKTYDNNEFLSEVVSYQEQILPVVDPNYKDYIPPAAARRMAKGIKMGVVASKIALQDAGLEEVDAIITGTGMGCLRDSEKFLSAILDNKEQYLTPTSFIQSTHNTVGGQIALELQCKGYNFTYVHSSVSFESAMMDAKLQLELDEAKNILIGGVDEIGEYTAGLHKIIGHIKPEAEDVLQVLQSKTKGAIYGEGANFFVLSNERNENSYGKIKSVSIFNTLSKSELNNEAEAFLSANGVSAEDIDVVVLGNNGDVEFDGYYETLANGLFQNTPQVCYKHLCGEFNTASSFGFWVTAKMLKNQALPEVLRFNDFPVKEIKQVLLYNQYRGENHSFTLVEQC
ncbi:beta-ketoacyl synthase N-terminal-like domain-containing protein [Mangrovimonas xylaniphaga]|uniref:beta-ketoacyl synthase N-terminal-like domain-containing protein n=1 Tax=Mangrovimonas xylaniphaga TaxID=1645915 RepID=UPI0006B5C137|nr:beta-ketoacyl synthase N-terminal-like domain-containing protein [Mangrovimonas xylaniphaga]